MTVKPDDIPQDVWDAAYRLAESSGFSGWQVRSKTNLPDAWQSVTELDALEIAQALMAERSTAYRQGLQDAMRVRPLVWREYDLTHDYGHGLWEAGGIRHTYEILDVGSDGLKGYRYYLRGVSQFETLDEAKAAAQANYAACVLSALEVP